MTYVTNEVGPARPPSAIRSERLDWHSLTDAERTGVALYLGDTTGLMTLNDVPARGREYLRRHHGKEVRS